MASFEAAIKANLPALRYMHTDFAICCKDGGIHAHKVILACHSTYFREWLERNPGAESIDIMNEDSILLSRMVEYFYTSTYSSISATMSATAVHLNIFQMADNYGCLGLKREACRRFAKTMEESNLDLETFVAATKTIEEMCKAQEDPFKYGALKSLSRIGARNNLTALLKDHAESFSGLLTEYPKWTLSFLEHLDDELRRDDTPRASQFNLPSHVRDSSTDG